MCVVVAMSIYTTCVLPQSFNLITEAINLLCMMWSEQACEIYSYITSLMNQT